MTWNDAVAYLDGKEKDWLLFVDNADSPELDLRPYFPRSPNGAILITTRNRECVDYAPDGAIAIGGLEESEAVSLLHAVADIAPSSDAKSLEIVRELGMLALPITQAGAYIRKTCRLDTYLDTFRSHRDQLMRKQLDRDTEYTSSTYAAFDLSFQQLPGKTQELLKLFACLYHSLVPIFLFEESTMYGFAYPVHASFPPPESDNAFIVNLEGTLGVKWDEDAFQELVDPALRASLISISSDGLYYGVHPLVQTYIKDGLGEEETQRYIRMTVQLLLGAIWLVEGSNSRNWQLLPHINSIPRSVQTECLSRALAFCTFYESLGDWRPCQELLESALSQAQVTRDHRHEGVVWLKGVLASTLHHCGRLEDSETMWREVLAVQLEIHGGRHPDTIKAMSQIALALHDRGQLEDAEKMKREVLALRLEIHGDQHQDTIKAMHELAICLHDRGQLDDAEKMKRQVLASCLNIHGELHPYTIDAMANLAITLHNRGQLDEAERMRREVLALLLETQGGRHPATISAMNNLAITLSSHGQLEEAERMAQEVFTLRLDILGGRHPQTLEAMHNLASTLNERGQLDDAEKMQREALALQIEIQGRRHPQTLLAMHNLASTLHVRGQLDEAEKMKREVLAVRLEIYGGRHPHTILAMFNLVRLLDIRGQLDEVEKRERELLAVRRETQGARHPDTLDASYDLSVTFFQRDQLEEATTLLQELIPLCVETLGKGHRRTVSAKKLLRDTKSKQSRKRFPRRLLSYVPLSF